MLGGKGVGFGAFQVKHADQTILQQQRNDELGTRVIPDIAFYVASVQEGVVDAQDAALTGSGAGQSGVQRDRQPRRDGVAVALRKSAFEVLCAFVKEHHGENVIVDQFFHALSDAPQQFLAVEDGGNFPADLVEQRERVGLLGVGDKQARGDGISVTHQGKGSEFGSFIHNMKYTSVDLNG